MMPQKYIKVLASLINIFHWFTQEDFWRFSHWWFLSILTKMNCVKRKCW